MAGSERGVRNAPQHYPTHCTCDEKCGSFPEVSEVGVAHGLVAPLRRRGGEGQLLTKLEHRGEYAMYDVHDWPCLLA